MKTLEQTLTAAFNNKLSELNTCLPGRIEKYDYKTQKADIKPLIKKKYKSGTVEPLPVIVNVPVIFPRTADTMIHFPLNRGDGVIIMFAQRSIDTWLSKGGDSEPGDPRKMDLSDAIAIPGLYDFKAPTLALDNTNFRIRFKTGKITINPNGKVAFGNSNGELVDLLDQLLDLLIAATTATSLGSQFLSVVLSGQMNTLKTDLEKIKGSL